MLELGQLHQPHFHPTSTLATGFAQILAVVSIIMRRDNSASNAILSDQVGRIRLPVIIARIHMEEDMAAVVLQGEVDHLQVFDQVIGSAPIHRALSKILLHELAAFAVILLVPMLLSTTTMAHRVVPRAVPV
jgi:hypothetical protein